MRRLHAGILLLLFVAPVGLLLLALQTREPSYQGRRASDWIRDMQGHGLQARNQAEASLRAMGTNVLPVLRRKLRCRDSALKLSLVRLVWRQNRWRVNIMLARNWRVRAALACAALGSLAEPLVPDLLQMAKGDFVDFEVAVSALSQVGPRAVPRLQKALADPNVRVRQASVRALGGLGPLAKAAAPDLAKRLRDPDAQVRVNACAALGAIGAGSDEVVGGLAAALSDANSDVRDNAVDALGQLGVHAKAALPALVQRLSDPEELVRLDTTNVLESLSRESRKGRAGD